MKLLLSKSFLNSTNTKSKLINSKLCLLVFLSILTSSLSYAQNQKRIDSLNNILKMIKHDTSKVMLYHKLGNEYEINKPEDAGKYYLEALALARKINFRKGIALHLGNYGRVLSNMGKNQESVKYFEECLGYYKELNDQSGIALAYDNMGITNINLGNYELALEQRKKSIEIYEKLKDTEKVGSGYQWIGNIYMVRRDFKLALEHYMKAFKVFEKNKNENYAFTIASIATIYRHQKQFDKAKELLQSAISIFEKVGNQRAIATTYQNLGNLEGDQKKYNEALKYYSMSLKISEDVKDSNGMAHMFNSIAMTKSNLGNLDEAEAYYKKGFDLAIKNGNKQVQSIILHNLTNIAGKKDDLKGYLDYAQKSLKLGKELKAKDIIASGYFLVSCAYDNMNEGKKALNYYKLYKRMDDSLKEEKFSKNSLELMTKYETEKKEKAINELTISNLKKEKANLLLMSNLKAEKQLKEITELNFINTLKEKKNLELQSALETQQKNKAISALNIKNLEEKQARQQRETWLWLVGAMAVITMLGAYLFKTRRDFQFTQQISEVRQEALNAQMNDHFISNSMDSINSFIEENDKKQASHYLLTFNRLIRRVLENSFKKTISLKEDLSILEDYISLEKLRFENDSLIHEIIIDKTIDSVTTKVPPMIFQVLAENAIKHAFSKDNGGKLTIKVLKNENKIDCVVEDNGGGRNASSNIGNTKFRTSLGTSIAEKLVKLSGENKTNTTFSIKDLVNSQNQPIGTRVTFTMPLKVA